ncbi:hypothetical protein B9Z19DRAFT_299723 [Tuber borchii]|uniref:Uncharacterized protein n=1 Tax=Tuber borchii TaxID=42251 RepID=A0A2T7A4Y9_TUBBO|nr:hypothetical protein B9Z19DRAFT_299723 [Tuber borchii]
MKQTTIPYSYSAYRTSSTVSYICACQGESLLTVTVTGHLGTLSRYCNSARRHTRVFLIGIGEYNPLSLWGIVWDRPKWVSDTGAPGWVLVHVSVGVFYFYFFGIYGPWSKPSALARRGT